MQRNKEIVRTYDNFEDLNTRCAVINKKVQQRMLTVFVDFYICFALLYTKWITSHHFAILTKFFQLLIKSY